MATEFALVAPTTEEMTRVAAVGAGGLVAGGVEGVIIATIAPKLGALKVPFEWMTLLGVPVAGAAVALMTKGILSDLGLGIAAGGAAMIGSTLPGMLEEFTLAKPGGGRGLTTEQRAALAAQGNIKQLGAGNPLKVQQSVAHSMASSLEF